jgi:alpha-glucosidase
MVKDGACVIAVNNRDEAFVKSVSVWELGIPKDAKLTQIMLSTSDGFTQEEKVIEVERGKVSLEMPKKSAIVLKYVK